MRRAVLLPLLLLAGACARPVAVGSDPAAAYPVEVTNATGASLQVSFEPAAGGVARDLGTVAAGATERFLVVSPGGPSVTLVGQASSFTVREPVVLRAGETVRITLRR